MEFDLSKQPAEAPSLKVYRPFEDAPYRAPTDLVELGKTYRIAPPLALCHPVAVHEFERGDRPPLCTATKKPDLETVNAYETLSLELTVDEWLACYGVFFAVLRSCTAEKAYDFFANCFGDWIEEVFQRLHPRTWPMLRQMDFNCRRSFFQELKRIQDDFEARKAQAKAGEVVPAPAPPKFETFTKSAFATACSAYGISAEAAYNPHLIGDCKIARHLAIINEEVKSGTKEGKRSTAAELAQEFAKQQKVADLKMLQQDPDAIRNLVAGVVAKQKPSVGSTLLEALVPSTPGGSVDTSLSSLSQQDAGKSKQYGHPSSRLPVQTAVQAAATGMPVPAAAGYCGLCGAEGSLAHDWRLCTLFNPAIVQRYGDGFGIVGQNRPVCVQFQGANGCGRQACSFQHACAACGDVSGDHGRRTCVKTYPHLVRKRASERTLQSAAKRTAPAAPPATATQDSPTARPSSAPPAAAALPFRA